MKTPPTVIAAALTPCLEKGIADPGAMRHLTRFLAARGCDGIFVVSSTGEAALLDEGTRRQLTVAAKEGAEAQIWVGASGLGAEHTVRLCKAAACDGADGVIIMAPHFVQLTQQELINYCQRIADASALPVGLYHHMRMPTAFSAQTVAVLAGHPNIVSLKDTSGDLERIAEIVALTKGTGFSIYQGSEHLVLASLELGATGCVSALANILPELHRQLVDHFAAGRLEVARRDQSILNAFWATFKQPEAETSFSHFVRSLTLPLCWRGVFSSLASLTSDPMSMEVFDDWLAHYYGEHGLDHLIGAYQSQA
jgi:4-hydroxy-tetrahydrodipicolinate synthase